MSDLFHQFIKTNKERGGVNFFIAEKEFVCRGPDCNKRIRLSPDAKKPTKVTCPRCEFPQTITPRKK